MKPAWKEGHQQKNHSFSLVPIVATQHHFTPYSGQTLPDQALAWSVSPLVWPVTLPYYFSLGHFSQFHSIYNRQQIWNAYCLGKVQTVWTFRQKYYSRKSKVSGIQIELKSAGKLGRWGWGGPGEVLKSILTWTNTYIRKALEGSYGTRWGRESLP